MMSLQNGGVSEVDPSCMLMNPSHSGPPSFTPCFALAPAQSSSLHSRAGCSLELIAEDKEFVEPCSPFGDLQASHDSMEGSLYMLQSDTGSVATSSSARALMVVRGLHPPSSPANIPASRRPSPFSSQPPFPSPEARELAAGSDLTADSLLPPPQSLPSLSSFTLPTRRAASALSSELSASLAQMSLEHPHQQPHLHTHSHPQLHFSHPRPRQTFPTPSSADMAWPSISVHVAPLAPPSCLYRSASACELYQYPEKHVRGGRPYGGSASQLQENKMHGGLCGSRGDFSARSSVSMGSGVHSPCNSQVPIPGLKIVTVRSTSFMAASCSQASDLDACGTQYEPGSSSVGRRSTNDGRLSLDDGCKVRGGVPGSANGEHKVHGGLTRGSSRSSCLDTASVAMGHEGPSSARSSITNSLPLASTLQGPGSYGQAYGLSVPVLGDGQRSASDVSALDEAKWAAIFAGQLQQSPVDSVLGSGFAGSPGMDLSALPVHSLTEDLWAAGLSLDDPAVPGQGLSTERLGEQPAAPAPTRTGVQGGCTPLADAPQQPGAPSTDALVDCGVQGGREVLSCNQQQGASQALSGSQEHIGSQAADSSQEHIGSQAADSSQEQGGSQDPVTPTGSHPPSSSESQSPQAGSHDHGFKGSHEDCPPWMEGTHRGGNSIAWADGSVSRSTAAPSTVSDAPTVTAWCADGTAGADEATTLDMTGGTASTGLVAFSSSTALDLSRSPSQDVSSSLGFSRTSQVLAIDRTPSLGMMYKVRRASNTALPTTTSVAGPSSGAPVLRTSSGLWGSGLDMLGVQAFTASAFARDSVGTSRMMSCSSIGGQRNGYSNNWYTDGGPSAGPSTSSSAGPSAGPSRSCYDDAQRPSLLQYAESMVVMNRRTLSGAGGSSTRQNSSGPSGLHALG